MNSLDDALLGGDLDALEAALSEELDSSELFGDEGDSNAEPEQNQNIEAEQQQPTETSDKPEVIDSLGITQQQGSNSPEESEEAPQNKDGIKEIDGQLYVAVDANNAEISSKGGKHQIPYDVLDKHRRGERELQSKIDELTRQLSDSETTQQKAKLFEEQLKEAGITPDRLPEELLRDPDAAKTIADEIGGVAGQIISALVAKNQANQQAQQPDQSQGASLEEILALPELANLNSWFDSDKERWTMAVEVDAQLQSDPQWQSMSDAERFIEVQRLVEASFGDPVETGAKKELAEQEKPQGQQQPKQAGQQQDVIPNSPSSLVGSGQDTKAQAREALANADVVTLENAMSGMKQDEIEDLLEEAAAAFD